MTRHEHRYGPAPAQVADLWLPDGVRTPTRTAVLVHGGFWRAGHDRSLEDPLVSDLLAAGWAVWNVDYRGVGDGGGWPATLTDVAAAADLLGAAAGEHGLDLTRTAVLGHSAGGQLALWLAARAGLPEGAPGSVGPAVTPDDPARPAAPLRPAAVVAQAGVDDLGAADAGHVGGDAVADLLGGHAGQVPERYAVTDPAQLVPLGVPVLVVTGDADDVVPPALSASFARAARAAHDAVEHAVVAGEDHMAHLDPASGCWRATRAWLDRVLPA